MIPTLLAISLLLHHCIDISSGTYTYPCRPWTQGEAGNREWRDLNIYPSFASKLHFLSGRHSPVFLPLPRSSRVLRSHKASNLVTAPEIESQGRASFDEAELTIRRHRAGQSLLASSTIPTGLQPSVPDPGLHDSIKLNLLLTRIIMQRKEPLPSLSRDHPVAKHHASDFYSGIKRPQDQRRWATERKLKPST